MQLVSYGVRVSRTSVLVLVLSLLPALAQTAPTITRVEPPNWWIGFERHELLVLLSGSELAGAQVSAAHAGVKIGRVQAQPGGRYVFAWIDVAANATPGAFPLTVRTPRGQTSIAFSLERRPSAAGKYAGLSPDDIVYLLMPDRFADGDTSNDELPDRPGSFDRHAPKAYHGGDLKGVRDHLAYLKDLGVTAIWLTPFWANLDADYHGYHVVNFYGVDTHFGTTRDVQELVADAHKVGIKVVLDYVVNHTGPRHPWATDPPTPTWLHGTPEHHIEAQYKFDGIVDPHASYAESRPTLEGWFVNRLPDLNPDDPLLETYLLENAIWWTEMSGLDAFRLDTFPYSSRKFWSRWHQGIFRVYPHTFSIGEVSDPDPTIVAFFQGGRRQWDGIDSGVTSVFDFPLMHALRDVIVRGKPIQRMIDVLERDWVYSHPELLMTFIGNHDNKRFLSEEGSSTAKLKAAFSLLFTMRGIPQMYYGDEIAMSGGDDPDNRHDFPGGFPGDARNAFTAQGRTSTEQEMFDEVRKLIALRQAHSSLRDGRQVHIGWDETYYAFTREDQNERLLIVYNNSAAPRTIDLDFSFTPLEQAAELLPLFQAQSAHISSRHAAVAVPPFSIAVYQVK